MKDKNETPRRNGMGVNLEERIKSGRTIYFDYTERRKAIDYANERRSYIDDCYIDGELVGYCVPK